MGFVSIGGEILEYVVMRVHPTGRRTGDLMAGTRVADLKPERKDGAFLLISIVLMVGVLTGFPLVLQKLAGGESNSSRGKPTDVLRVMSAACEQYAAVNQGKYPTDMNVLITANPPYINSNFCDQKFDGYDISCYMTPNSYEFSALPELGSGDKKSYKVSTGNLLTEF